MSFVSVHERALRVLVEGFVRLGLLAGKPEELIAADAYRRFYMHRTSHWLGLDVHDCGAYVVDGGSRTLEPGMVLTVEPGCYVAEDDESVPARWHGIGIRIEDDLARHRRGPRGSDRRDPEDGRGARGRLRGTLARARLLSRARR